MNPASRHSAAGDDMGNRANIVVVNNQNWELFYSHWAGCRMLDALVAGPEYALRYIATLSQG